METVYDWVTVAIFAGLIVLFLQRSSGAGEPQDSIWQYLAASVGCALANYVGNEAVKHGENGAPDYLFHALAIAILAATVGYVWYALKPFKRT
ncbi:XrtV sorting system accessory protein [uncultured Sphingomonas sp.]|uniref:XrtV sorting system accessory protein n=1 Tax=uncultured Sphingomonas sp. TaxID=158754 RepID=UPI0025DFBA69|nr:XrtV sorting system accessory protein [uncultured Sphingomonas sp.]